MPTVDPLVEKFYSISPYVYCYNNPVKFVDPTGMEIDAARVYTETKDFGHTWISAGEGKNMTVYTYGRYGEVYEESHGRRVASNGEGVLVKLEGKAAAYNNKKAKETEVTVFQILDISDEEIKTFFDEKFNSSNESPLERSYKNSKNARVIDKYKLFSNNYTTMVADALNEAGSNALIISPWNLFK